MSDLSITSDQLEMGIFIEAIEKDMLTIECNYCRVEFYSGKDYEANGTHWMADATKHLIDKHKKELTTP